MYLDFHTHGKLSKKLPFSQEYTHWLFSEAKHAGLDALCLTEHFNTLGFDQLYRYIAGHAERDGDTLVFDGLRIFPGMETDIAEGGHILSIGPMEAILELNRRLEPYKEKGRFLPFAELMDRFDQYPVIVGGAHPYREDGHIPELPRKQLERFHFFDLNGKDAAERREPTERLTAQLGGSLDKPVVGGSDTHQAVQYGCIRTRFETACKTVAELHREMQNGSYEICIAEQAAFQVKTAGLLKRALKEIHALGGDYVSVLLGKDPAWAAFQAKKGGIIHMAEKQYAVFQQAAEVVCRAGRILTDSSIKIEVREKGKTDFVTQLDLAVQTALHKELQAIAPQYRLMAEEQDNRRIGLRGKLWILDPVDGTTNLIHHFCHSAVSLAMAEDGAVIGGIVFQPFTNETFTAFSGEGAYCSGKRIHVSASDALSESLFSVGTNPGCRENADRAFSVMRSFYDRRHDIRRMGAASIEICYVAAGRLDGYMEHGLKPWDYAAGALILKEAGGRCTDCKERLPPAGRMRIFSRPTERSIPKRYFYCKEKTDRMHLQFPQKADKLTPAEQRLLEFIEENREEFLFMTIGQLASRMGVSEATISRFARHLGCRDFKQLKNAVIGQNHMEGPAVKLAGTLLMGGSFQAAAYLQQQQTCLEKTIGHLDEKSFEASLQEILSAKRIFIHAKSASACVGQLLFFRLRRLGLGVTMIPSGGSEMLEGLAQAEAGDLVILFGFSKVSWEGRVILNQQKETGYRTLCFTSRLHAPEEDKADVSLYVYRGDLREYHSMTAAVALVDALVVAVSERLGADGAKSLHKLHQMKKRYRI